MRQTPKTMVYSKTNRFSSLKNYETKTTDIMINLRVQCNSQSYGTTVSYDIATANTYLMRM